MLQLKLGFIYDKMISVIKMELKSAIMDESAVRRAIKRISFEIEEKNKGFDKVCLIGVRRRGVSLANMIAECIKQNEDISVPVGSVDITKYRDDIGCEKNTEHLPDADIPCGITGMNVIIVDDVIHTGRTVRAAIDALFSMGRPSSIQLAVLVDRGHRELPIRPDYVGKNIPTSSAETVKVNVEEFDGEIGVAIFK